MTTAAASATGREVRAIGLVTGAHFLSHFYQLALPPLFPLMAEIYGLSYLQLGVIMTVAGVSTGLSQTPVGFLVDRVGARNLLIGGLALYAVAIGAFGLTENYWIMLLLAALGGLGNSVFHPADFSILSASVDKGRLGRAFSYHAVSGNLGWAAAPIVMIALAQIFGLQVAFLAAGAAGLVVATLLASQFHRLAEESGGRKGGHSGGKDAAGAQAGGELKSGIALLLSRPVMMCFLFQCVFAMAFGGIRNFSVAALDVLYGVPLAVVTTALSAYLVGSSFGNLVGGWLADKTERPLLLFVVIVLLVSALTGIVGMIALPFVVLTVLFGVAGTLQGSLLPSRDLLVRSVAPPGQIGKVFGFVSSGLGLGGAVTPVLYGWVMDNGDPRWVFYGSALFMLLALATYVETNRQVVRR
ncbi:MAG: MFS transporter [Alphaproteobacteria bacterium]